MASVRVPRYEIDAPHFESRHAGSGDSGVLPAGTRSESGGAVGALAIGALACGALAFGALAIGRLAVGSLAIGRSRIRRLQIEELDVNRFRVRELDVVDATAAASEPDSGRTRAPVDSAAPDEASRVAAGAVVHAQPLIAVHDVEASSAWYQAVLGVQSGHGGAEYERLMSQGRLVMQLHHWHAHEHPHLGDSDSEPYGNGVLLWFQTEDFDGALRRIESSRAVVLEGPMVNPSANHREVWLRDPNGYKVVVAGRYGDVGSQRTNDAQPVAAGDAPQAASR